MNELIIDDSNFDEHFFDARKSGPKQGQVLAKFRARAELIEGHMKEQLVYLLKNMPNGGESCVKVMQKLGCATYSDSMRVPIEMAEDLLKGLSDDEVLHKPYEYDYEQFFYTRRENIPQNDPHWSVIEILNLDDHLERKEVTEAGTISSKIIIDKKEADDS